MQFYDVSQTSLAKSGSSVVEEYIPLWMADGTIISTTVSIPNSVLLTDGAGVTTAGGSYAGSQKLHTLNSSWNTSTKFAFETTIYASSNTAYVALWDMTTNTEVSGSRLSTTSTTAAVLRSGQFTLTQGHMYGVTIWGSGSITVYCTDASLVVFGQ